MAGEYRTLGLYPSGHLMAHLRQYLGEDVAPSFMVSTLPDGTEVKVAGLVIRRQRPGTASGVVFLTLILTKCYQKRTLHSGKPALLRESIPIPSASLNREKRRTGQKSD